MLQWPNGRQFFGLDFFDNDVPQDDEERYIVDAFTDRAIQSKCFKILSQIIFYDTQNKYSF